MLLFISKKKWGVLHNTFQKRVSVEKYQCKNINTISKWMKYQSILFILFLTMYFLNIKFSIAFIEFSIFSSLLIALYFSYNIKVIFNKEKIIEL